MDDVVAFLALDVGGRVSWPVDGLPAGIMGRIWGEQERSRGPCEPFNSMEEWRGWVASSSVLLQQCSLWTAVATITLFLSSQAVAARSVQCRAGHPVYLGCSMHLPCTNASLSFCIRQL